MIKSALTYIIYNSSCVFIMLQFVGKILYNYPTYQDATKAVNFSVFLGY